MTKKNKFIKIELKSAKTEMKILLEELNSRSEHVEENY